MGRRRILEGLSVIVLLSATVACSDSDGTPGQPDPGSGVAPKRSGQQQEELNRVNQALSEVAGLDSAAFGQRYAVPFSSELGYDPLAAAGLETIQASSLALNDAERQAFADGGFVVTNRQRFPTFTYGYQTLYLQDLPLYVSADSILYALHRSYDSALRSIEVVALIPALDRFLGSMRQELAGGKVAPGTQVARDVDLYLTVALSLLRGTAVRPAADGDAKAISALVASAGRAFGTSNLDLFGVPREIDFSQFEPRGHYTMTEELKRYFRAMMWLGRIDLRLIETQPDHSQVFHRRQLEAALALSALVNAAAMRDFQAIDRTINAFVGEQDSMTLPQVGALLGDLGISDASALAELSDEKIAQVIVDGGYGTQRISSHIMINGLGEGTMPLSSSFLLFGQRYVVDSHVFSNVVYDRVQKGAVYRMMPDPLDAAFAALGSDHAGQLLLPELENYGYAPDLASMRVLVDAHGADYWQKNLYNSWLGAIRALSPTQELADPAAAGLPRVAASERWGRRVLGTQLASWAELRHDTLLYAKQSYTGGASCEFPDAYVDPYPEFYARVGELAVRARELIQGLDFSVSPVLSDSLTGYFTRLSTVADTLGQMANNQRTGTPHSAEHLAFINRAVKIQMGCGDATGAEGWYADLFFDGMSAVTYDPTIADVHTQPTDEAGNMVGRVLHVGTGMPKLMVVSVDTCSGPRAYAGLVSSYYEHITEDFERLNDKEWATQLNQAPPPEVGWAEPIFAR